MKSPIKCDGEITASLKHLKQMIPKGSIVNSYLLFSGNVEFGLCESDRFVIGRTNKYVVKEFWNCMLEDPRRVYDILNTKTFSIPSDKLFYLLQDTWPQYPDPFVRAALFVYLNNCTEKGTISSGAPTTFDINPFSLSNIRKFKIENFHAQFDDVDCGSALDSIAEELESDFVLIPAGRFNFNLLNEATSVGHEVTRVNHKNIKTIFDSTTHNKVVLIYKFNPTINNMYKEYNKIMIDKRGYETNKKTDCEEIIVTNF